MENKNELKAAVDRARLAIKLSVIGGVLAAILFVLLIVIGIVNDSFVGSDVFALGIVPVAVSLLFSIAALIYGLLAKSAAIENEEKFLLENRKQNQMLDVEEDARFTAGRTFANYRKYAPYVINILAAVVIGVLLLLFANYWGNRAAERPLPENSLNSALVSIILALVAVATGAFYAGQSRMPSFRWLRPFGGWLMVTAVVFFGAGASSIFNYYQVSNADGAIARVAWWIFVVLGAEFLVSFVIEFYRPRTLEEPRPLFESRLLSLFTEPGGVMRNAAEALDYQFGFKVSGTWIYSFIEKSLFPLLIVWAAILWLSTSVYEVGPSEVGIRERFGRVVSPAPLRPGVYLELPWPFGDIKRFSYTQLHEVVAGENHDDGDHEEEEYADDGHGHTPPPKRNREERLPEVILWTQSHIRDESYFIVAVEDERNNAITSGERREAAVAPISLMGLHMPVQYRIRKDEIMDYAYGHRDPKATLKMIGEQVATEYMASCSLLHIMATNRREAALEMQKRIQAKTDERKLGIEIVAVNILDVHPPVEKVAPEFQAVIGARVKRETMVLEALAAQEDIEARAIVRKLEILQEANAYKYNVTRVAEAEGNRFQQQLTAYQAMPVMFRLNSLLDLMETSGVKTRKFIISAGLQNEIYELNFEEKERLDLIDADLGALNRN